MLVLISGTSGSGKSKAAEDKLESFEGKKFYVAAAKISDSEMAGRVEKHKAMRAGKNFMTVEREKNLGELKFPGGASVLIESLTAWLANEMFDGGKAENIFEDIKKLKAECENLIIVADDIFSDGIIYDEATEFYRKTLASLMVKIAREADEAIEAAGGIAAKIKGSGQKIRNFEKG